MAGCEVQIFTTYTCCLQTVEIRKSEDDKLIDADDHIFERIIFTFLNNAFL